MSEYGDIQPTDEPTPFVPWPVDDPLKPTFPEAVGEIVNFQRNEFGLLMEGRMFPPWHFDDRPFRDLQVTISPRLDWCLGRMGAVYGEWLHAKRRVGDARDVLLGRASIGCDEDHW